MPKEQLLSTNPNFNLNLNQFELPLTHIIKAKSVGTSMRKIMKWKRKKASAPPTPVGAY